MREFGENNRQNFCKSVTLIDAIRSFCERHLISDDPFQYERYSNDQVVSAIFYYRARGRLPKVLIDEIELRLASPYVSESEKEILRRFK